SLSYSGGDNEASESPGRDGDVRPRAEGRAMTESVDIGVPAEAAAGQTGAAGTLGASGRRLFGHPAGLWYLAFTEAWERFSYYGMQTLLVLYMVGQLLQPGHIENVAGFASFRAALEGVYGPLSIQALASAIFGIYTGLVYL